MSRGLIIAKNQETIESISTMLKDAGVKEIFTSTNSAQAHELIEGESIDLIVLITPLEVEFGLELIADLHSKTDAGIIVLTKSDICEEVQDKIRFTGAFVLGRPVSKQVFLQTIKFALIASEEIHKLKVQTNKLEQKLDDIKLIDKAKCCLIEYLRLTEAQAHRHIQKQAMDLRKSQREIAEDILKTYMN